MEQKTYAFVRSRTYYREYDYRLLTPITIISENVHLYFAMCVRNLLSDSSKNESEWNEPTWLFVKRDKYILWGLACNNSIFSKEACQEEVGQRGVRCFCGVVYVDVDLESLKLPYSIKAFQPVFDSTVGKYWKERISEKADIIVSLGEAAEYIEGSMWKEELNKDPHICRLLPASSNARALLSASMASSFDMSIAINATERDQVYNPKSEVALLNAIMRHEMVVSDLPIKRKCKNCGSLVVELVDGLCEECDRKKTDGINEVENQEEKTLYQCNECGEQKEWINENGLCIACEEKLHRKKMIRYICIGLSILLLLCVKMCSAGHKRCETSSFSTFTPSDTITHMNDSINMSPQK